MPAETAELKLISAILKNEYPPNSSLPPERELAGILGVTRPTLREVLQRLARDGWLDIQHGKPTRVRNYLVEGSLSLLGDAASDPSIQTSLLSDILMLRALLAPTYARIATQLHPEETTNCMSAIQNTSISTKEFAEADWRIHYKLAQLSENTVMTLIWKNLESCYIQLMAGYYADETKRQQAATAYRMVGKAARVHEPEAAEAMMKRYTQESAL